MKKFNTVTGEELLSKEIPEIPFVVKDLIPIGLTLLAGFSCLFGTSIAPIQL